MFNGLGTWNGRALSIAEAERRASSGPRNDRKSSPKKTPEVDGKAEKHLIVLINLPPLHSFSGLVFMLLRHFSRLPSPPSWISRFPSPAMPLRAKVTNPAFRATATVWHFMLLCAGR